MASLQAAVAACFSPATTCTTGKIPAYKYLSKEGPKPVKKEWSRSKSLNSKAAHQACGSSGVSRRFGYDQDDDKQQEKSIKEKVLLYDNDDVRSKALMNASGLRSVSGASFGTGDTESTSSNSSCSSNNQTTDSHTMDQTTTSNPLMNTMVKKLATNSSAREMISFVATSESFGSETLEREEGVGVVERVIQEIVSMVLASDNDDDDASGTECTISTEGCIDRSMSTGEGTEGSYMVDKPIINDRPIVDEHTLGNSTITSRSSLFTKLRKINPFQKHDDNPTPKTDPVNDNPISKYAQHRTPKNGGTNHNDDEATIEHQGFECSRTVVSTERSGSSKSPHSTLPAAQGRRKILGIKRIMSSGKRKAGRKV